MFKIFGLLTKLKYLVILILLFAIWQAWVFVHPRPSELDARQRVVLTRAVEEAVARVRKDAGGTVKMPLQAGVIHLGNDPRDTATDLLREALAAKPEISLPEGSVITTFLKDLRKALLDSTSVDEVIHAGRRSSLDVVLYGKVLTENLDAGQAAALELSAVNGKQGGHLFEKQLFTGRQALPDSIGGNSDTDSPAKAKGWLLPILGILVALALPWLLARPLESVLDKKSNTASAFFLAVLSVADMVLLWGGWTLGNRSFPMGWLLLAIFLACAAWNFFSLEKLAKMTR